VTARLARVAGVQEKVRQCLLEKARLARDRRQRMRDLGVELDLQIYYQGKDGSLNDDPTKLGGFYSMLQYGAFFPLGGLSYLPGEQASASTIGANFGTSVAQTVRLFLGIAF